MRAALLGILAGVLAVAAAEPEIAIVFPKEGGTFTAGQTVTYVMGSVKPADVALTLNGQPVAVYAKTGSFVTMAPLRAGKNELLFQAGKTTVKRTVTVPVPPPKADGGFAPVSPVSPIGVMTGEVVNLVCQAPTGRVVKATVGRQTVPLAPDPKNPALYRGRFSSASDLAEAPVRFSCNGFPDADGASVTVRSVWPSYRVTGKLFEVRARSLPGDGETIGFPKPGISLAATGFRDGWLRFKINGGVGWVPLGSVSANKRFGKPVDRLEDLAKGFAPRPPIGKRPKEILVVLDPGHGGSDTGALGPGGTQEKEANWKQAKAIEKALKAAGFKVKLTRQGDQTVGLYERVRFAYENHADLFISVHHNSTATQTDPREVRHFIGYGWNPRGLDLARALHPKLAAVAGIPDRGVREASFAVCRNPAVPSCLFEFDFINCPEGEDAIFNTDRRDRFGAALAEALTAWISEKPKPAVQEGGK
ncbi:MAG: N-acetylmuramoyl-L-alanine amidase [Kiritimatiellae bacterium]|nr:N-acetylmuramoyl-L-alanine amidase [Kiritimatiellia bacterium]